MGGVAQQDSISATAFLNLRSPFGLFVSAFKNPFPGNGDRGSKRHGSTALGAVELLPPVYGWFTEGFDTRDLKKAKGHGETYRESQLTGRSGVRKLIT